MYNSRDGAGRARARDCWVRGGRVASSQEGERRLGHPKRDRERQVPSALTQQLTGQHPRGTDLEQRLPLSSSRVGSSVAPAAAAHHQSGVRRAALVIRSVDSDADRPIRPAHHRERAAWGNGGGGSSRALRHSGSPPGRVGLGFGPGLCGFEGLGSLCLRWCTVNFASAGRAVRMLQYERR